MIVHQSEQLNLMRECIHSFHQVTKLGSLLCAPDGSSLEDVGYSVKQCRMCEALSCSADICAASRSRAWREAERFGGKYIYDCPKGLTCIATPVQTDYDTIGFITAGPLLMVETEDYLSCELHACVLEAEQQRRVEDALRRIPRITPEEAEAMAKQLFLSVGGVGKAFSIGSMLERQNTIRLMGDLSEFTNDAKQAVLQTTYPFQIEKEFLDAVSHSDKTGAEKLLNQLLGHIFFLTGGDFSYIRARICELLVLCTRAAIDGGVDETQMMTQSQRYIEQMQEIYDVDKLCFWLPCVLKQVMLLLFSGETVNDREIMPRALSYIRDHLGERISLDVVAQVVHLSPSYFSRLFKAQTGQTFSEYLQTIRIERAKSYLKREDCTLTEITAKIGYFDQSHFIKAFKQATGVTPGLYRRHCDRGYNELNYQKKRKTS